MECRDAQFFSRIRRSGSDELDPDLGIELDAHLAGCSTCSAEILADSRFDNAVATAMKSVPVPSGLKYSLIAKAGVQRRAMLRRTVSQYAAVAATILLAIGITVGAMGGRPQPDIDGWVRIAESQAGNPEAAVQRWLSGQKLPAQLPEPFDYSLLVSCGIEKIQGEEVPVIIFRDRQNLGSAKVLILKNSDFDLKNVQEAQASFARAIVYNDQRKWPGIVYVVVLTGTELKPFLKPGGDQA
jgi:hypothetical protein